MSMPQVFRCSQNDRRWTIAAIVLFFVLGMASAWFFMANGVPEARFWAACIVGGSYIALALFGLWEYLWITCSTINIDDRQLVRTSLMRRDVFEFHRLDAARWLLHRSGIELLTGGQRLRIYFAYYEQSEPWTMIDLLHERILDDRQQNWPLFCNRFALPLRIGNTDRPIAAR